jgi:hypothetical protein
MKFSRQVLVRWSVLLAIAAGSWYAYRTLYASKRDAILSNIASSQSSIESLDRQLAAQFEVSDRSKAATATTLGVKLDDVSARFRDGLSRIAESNGLTGVIVDHGEPQEVKSPLLVAKSVPAALKSTLRNSADFSVLRGTLRASGTVEQALATLASVQSQPWVHRIEGFTIRPGAGGKDAARCEIRIEAATLLAPRLRSDKIAEPVIAQTDEAVKAMIAQIAGRRVLAKTIIKTPDAAPTVTVAAAATPDGQPAPVPPQPFAPYEEWRLTGVFSGRSGPEAFFVNIKSGQRVTVQRGGAVLDAVFIEATGERVILDIGGRRFEVLTGQVLSSRKPVV